MRTRTLGLLALCVVSSAPVAQAQNSWRIAAGPALVFGSETESTCPDGDHRLGLALQVGRRVRGVFRLEANVSLHQAAINVADCVLVLPPPVSTLPPPDGTYLVEYRPRPLLDESFASADLRARAVLPGRGVVPTASLGVGRIWQDDGGRFVSQNRNFGVLGLGVVLGPGGRWEVAAEGEYRLLRSAVRQQWTTWLGGFQGPPLVRESHEWVGAGGVSLRVGLTF